MFYKASPLGLPGDQEFNAETGGTRLDPAVCAEAVCRAVCQLINQPSLSALVSNGPRTPQPVPQESSFPIGICATFLFLSHFGLVPPPLFSFSSLF